MTVEKQKRTLVSKSYDTLEKADAFVYRDFEPADAATIEIVTKLASDLGLPSKGQVQSLKYIRCLSDFIVATRTTETGLIAWTGGAGEYAGPPYGHSIAATTRKALLRKGIITLHQKASKRDGLARLFMVDFEQLPALGRYKLHGLGPLVIVKSKKETIKGKTTGGTPMGRKQFEPQISKLEKQIVGFNKLMTAQPLVSPKGVSYGRCYRVFNNGSLRSGGRLYGPWQSTPEPQRLAMTIEGEPVCEIDLKASFLSIAHGLTGSKAVLPPDPYQKIKFVRDAKGTDEEQKHRTAAKLLVNAYLCKEGDLKQFPKSKTKDKVTGKVVPFKKLHNLKKPCGFYMEQIHAAFPFLRLAKSRQFDLMFEEAKIVVSAMEELRSQGIVSWPVHDSLLVKKSDLREAERALKAATISQLGREITMDCSYLDESGEGKTEMIPSEAKDCSSDGLIDHYECVQDDEDFDLIEVA